MSKIYLDNNATTKCDLEVLNSMLPYLGEQFGNPSSIYSLGREVKEKIQEARTYYYNESRTCIYYGDNEIFRECRLPCYLSFR